MGRQLKRLWTAAFGTLIATQLTANESTSSSVSIETTMTQPTLTPPVDEISLTPQSSLSVQPATTETIESENTAIAANSASHHSVAPVGSSNSTFASGVLYAGPKWHEEAIGIQVGADYILWQVVQEGLDTVASNYYATGTNLPAQGSTSGPKFNPLSGFKVHGVLTLLTREDLDFFFQYSWLQRLNRSSSGNGSSTTVPLFNISGTNTYSALSHPVVSWNSVYRISYNVLDFETGRLSYLANDAIALRPYIGIRGVWNQSTWTPSYIGVLNFTSSNLNTNNVANSVQNTGGAGVRAGLNYVINYFSNAQYLAPLKLVGNLAFSGVYGRTCVDTTTYNQAVSVGTTGNTFVYNRSTVYRIIPIVDLSIGLAWNQSISRGDIADLYNIEIHALWETQSWINYGKQFASYTTPARSSNLTVQGLTVGATFGF